MEKILNTELHDCFFTALMIIGIKEEEAQGTVRCTFVSMRKIMIQAKIKRRLEAGWSKGRNSRIKR